jgi:Dolichyl-phosphate-mannose-protein mannosyltransferase
MSIEILEKRSSPTLLTGFLCAAIALGIIYLLCVRMYLAATLPFWLDETWSGMIASQPDWTNFWREAWLDCNPPLYYIFLFGWTTVFGESNLATRLPAYLLMIAAALMPLVWRPAGLTKFGAALFAVLLLLWQPALMVMIDARGYGLLIALATASCLVFVKLLEDPTRKLSAAWVALGTLMFLTHYYSGVLAIGQALVLAFRHRTAIIRLWPSALIALPGIIWFVFHMPRLADYARKDVIWYPPTTALRAFGHFEFIVAGSNLIALAAVVCILVLMVRQNRHRRLETAVSARPADRDMSLSILAAAVGFVLAITIALFQESLTHRYFIPLVPSALFGLVLAVQRCKAPVLSGLMLAFAFMVPSLNLSAVTKGAYERSYYGYQPGSDFVASYKPDQLLFFWDHPAGKILDPQSLERIGGYFLARDDMKIPTKAFVIGERENPNPVLAAAATGKRPAVIWLYDTMHKSSANYYPPAFENDPAWICQHRRLSMKRGKTPSGKKKPDGHLGTIACVKLQEKISD